jgi:glycosyltransferase involved in cell wall biosynthesis
MDLAPVSAVIPCYRCADTIGRAVGSVAAQTRPPAELILVDDGSGDGTLERLRALAASHPAGWIKVLALSENRGAADARNAGWAAATQPYLAFLDADDAWHPRKLEIQSAFMRQHPEVALCAHRHEILDFPEVPDRPVGELAPERISKASLLLSNNFFAPTMMMLRRDLPQRFLAGRRLVDDHLLWLQIVCAGHAFVRLSAKLAYTYKRPFGEGGLSGRLWAMEASELANYWILRRENALGIGAALALSAWSLAKFARRLALVGLRRARHRVESAAFR